jgi:hypothetical protein
MANGAWNRFFCACCGIERPLVDKVLLKAHARCTHCVKKRGRPTISQPVSYDHDYYEPPTIPADVMDAYREAYTE